MNEINIKIKTVKTIQIIQALIKKKKVKMCFISGVCKDYGKNKRETNTPVKKIIIDKKVKEK